ncbi:hypothetical protein BJV77DRAFT_1023270 [Russula vinacea]|nr:hypothetical protein BJV77DRAFT_1023270 [Russula vinacea]
MTSLLTNYSFLSPLKRQRAVRNRSNNNPTTTTPSKRANRLPVVPELNGEHDDESSSSCSATTSSSPSTPSHSTSPKAKRLSRYGKDQFGAFALTDDFLSAPPRAAPQPPSSSSPRLRSSSSSTKSMRQSVRLSAFDIVIDISASEPASPVSETPAEPSTPPRPRDLDSRSPPRSRSPTPSLTSMSACSSTEMPTTPGASDDEWPALRSPSDKMAVARPRMSKHPLMLSLLASDENSEDAFEFTLVPFSPVPGLEAEVTEVQEEGEQREEEEDALWYSRELSQVVSLSSPRAPSNSPTRPDSLLPLPRGSSSGTDQPSARSRMSKPLPAVPHPAVPNPHLDPTYPQYPPLPPRLTLHASAHPSTPPSPLSLPSPITPTSLHKRQSRRFPPASAPPTSPLPACKSLTITVPRASRRNSKDIVSEILNDVNAWSLGTPSTSTGSSTRSSTLILSPPRIPHSPALSVFSEYDPVEFIVSYAAARSPSPATPAPATSATAFAATFLDLEDEDVDEDEETEAEADATDTNSDRKTRSRWSCSTLATLAAPSSPTTNTSPSARFRFHLASVARRVRARRAGGNNNNHNNSNNNNSGSNNNGCGETAVGSMHVRSSSESAVSGSGSSSVSGTVYETTASSGSDLRRKPIPFELLTR